MSLARLFAPAALMLAAASSVSTAQVQPDRERTGRLESDFAPPIDLWLDQVSYDRGARMRPFFSSEPGAYVVVVRVTSDGELRVMYPSRPSEQLPYRLGQFADDRVPYNGDPSLNLHESSGQGFVFAIASYQRFDFSSFTQGRMWSTARLATFGRYGNPFEVVNKFIDRVLPASADFSLDYEVYEVYSRGSRNVYSSSSYGGRYGYSSIEDYHDACLTAFGIRYSYYCRSYRGGYYGPIIVGNPRTPRAPSGPGGSKMKRPRPVVPDPIVPGSPLEPEPAEGRIPAADRAYRAEQAERAERAARERYRDVERDGVRSATRREPGANSGHAERPRNAEPQRSAPVIYGRMPERRSEPRRESAPVVRAQPSAPARVEVRNEPRAEPRREAPRSVDKPAAKENGKN